MQCCECLHSRLLFANLVSKIVTSQQPIQSSHTHSRGQSFLMRNSIVKVQPGWKIFHVETILTRILQVKVAWLWLNIHLQFSIKADRKSGIVPWAFGYMVTEDGFILWPPDLLMATSCDLLQLLTARDLRHVVELILSYLDPAALAAAESVSPLWARVVATSAAAYRTKVTQTTWTTYGRCVFKWFTTVSISKLRKSTMTLSQSQLRGLVSWLLVPGRLWLVSPAAPALLLPGDRASCGGGDAQLVAPLGRSWQQAAAALI